MRMAVRFPGSRDTRRLPESGPRHNDSVNGSTRRRHLTFSFGRWKFEVGRADYPELRLAQTEAHPPVPDRRLLVSDSGVPNNFPEHRLSLQGIPRRDHTHPRVLDIVEGQLYNRLTQDQARYLDYRPGPPGPLRGQNCAVLLTDIVGFSSPARTDEDCRVIRNALYDMTDTMLRGIAEAWSESRGDGMLTVAWPGVPTATVIDRLRTELLPALERHNSTRRGPACFQLRAAIGVGPLVSDAMGPSGEVVTTIARLVEAPLFKQAMDESGASLGLIATPFVYESVIKHDRSLTGYRQVQVKVKTFSESAWMSLLGTPVSPHSDPYAAAA